MRAKKQPTSTAASEPTGAGGLAGCARLVLVRGFARLDHDEQFPLGDLLPGTPANHTGLIAQSELMDSESVFVRSIEPEDSLDKVADQETFSPPRRHGPPRLLQCDSPPASRAGPRIPARYRFESFRW